MQRTITIREHGSGGGLAITRRVLDAVRSYTIGRISLKDPALAKFFGAGYETAAGVPVTENNIWTFSAVYDAVNQSSSDIAKLPLNLRKRRKDGGSDAFEASKTHWLLKHEANRDMSAFEFRRTLQAHALTCKGAFAEIERNGVGQPIALWPLTPDRVEPFLESTKLPNGRFKSRLRYRIDGNAQHIIESENMLHVRGLGYDGYCAYPVIDKARQAIGLALAAERYAGAFFGNNSNLGGVLASDQDLDADQAKELQARIETIHKGPDRAWKMLVLGAGFKYFRTGVTPSESQMNDIRTKQVEEVARFFNFPVHKLKSLDRATNNNIEQQDLEYYKGHQQNWITNWEAEYDRKLVPSLEVGNQFFKHNVNAALRADTAARTAFYNAMLDRGVLCADDVLELEDLNPQPDGQGKMYLVQGAMVPKDTLVAMSKARVDLVSAQVEKTKQPPPPPPAPAAAPPAADQQVEEANARADRAEQAAEELRAAAAQERDARIAAEAAGTATVAELAALRDVEQRSSLLATQATALSVEMRAEAEAERRRATEAEEAREAMALTAADTEAQRAAAEARAITAEADQARSAAAALAAEERLTVANAETAAAAQRAADAEVAARATTDDRAGVDAARVAALADLEASRASGVVLAEERDQAIAAAALAAQGAAEARAESDRLVGESRTRATEADQRATAAETARIEAESARALAESRQAELEQQASALTVERDAAAARSAADVAGLATATTSAADAEAARAAEAEQRGAAEVRRQELEAQLAAVVAERDAATAAADEQRRLAEETARSVAEAREQLAVITAALADVRGATETTVLALQAGVTALERDRDEARALTATHEDAAAASARLVLEREAELRTVRQADADAMAGLIAAHRGLVVEVMRRAIERETDRARRAQQTPEKLRTWLDTFYDGHGELMRQALLPAMRVHLAFVRSAEDPIEATRRYVATHIADSERQIRTVLDGDADDLAASLPALLHRWDTERPSALADVLMRKELEYARRL